MLLVNCRCSYKTLDINKHDIRVLLVILYEEATSCTQDKNALKERKKKEEGDESFVERKH